MDQCIRVVDERTGDLIKLVDLRSREVIELANDSIRETLNMAQFSICFGFLLLIYAVCGLNMEKFFEFSRYASAIIFFTLFLYAFSSSSRTIVNPILYYFSFTYFCATFILSFLLHAMEPLYTSFTFFIFSLISCIIFVIKYIVFPPVLLYMTMWLIAALLERR